MFDIERQLKEGVVYPKMSKVFSSGKMSWLMTLCLSDIEDWLVVGTTWKAPSYRLCDDSFMLSEGEQLWSDFKTICRGYWMPIKAAAIRAIFVEKSNGSKEGADPKVDVK
jgi:hypothetical protein